MMVFWVGKEDDFSSVITCSENGYCKTILYPNPFFSLSSQSRSVRNAVASFIWTTKRDDLDFKFLRKVSHCYLSCYLAVYWLVMEITIYDKL